MDLYNISEKEFRDYLDLLDQNYYNKTSLITDDEYDKITEIFYERFNVKHKTRGYEPLKELVKMKLPYELWSLDKISLTHSDNDRAINELEKYKIKYDNEILIEDKIDGMTGLYHNNKLYTLGNGSIGNDITHFIDILKLPQIPKDMAVRGEIVFPRKQFKLYKERKPEAKNPRNSVTGIVNSKNIDYEAARMLKFYAYQIVSENKKASEQIYTLIDLGFNIPEVVTAPANRLTVDILKNYYIEREKLAPYDMDGLVLVSNTEIQWPSDKNPEHAIAFKVEGKTYETTVIRVVYSPSKDGMLKPVIQYDPIDIGDVVLNKASGFNAKYIMDNKIGPGTKILVTRSHGVIPYIVMILSPAKEGQLPEYPPENYRWNGVDLQLITENNTIIAKKLDHFVNLVNIEGISLSRLEIIVEHLNVRSIKDLLELKSDDLIKLPGFGQKLSEKVIEEIKDKTKRIDIATLMAASGVFDRNFNIKRASELLKFIPDLFSLEQEYENLYDKIIQVKGFGEILSDQIASALPKFIEWYDLIKDRVKTYVKKDDQTSGKLKGKYLVATGFRFNDVEKRRIESMGGKVVERITKRDAKDIILIVFGNRETSKIKNAKSDGADIISKTDFEENFLYQE